MKHSNFAATMKIVQTVAELSAAITQVKAGVDTTGRHRVGFVPTMGALHRGHISLVERAREQADVVVVSVFVNPTQFNDPKDLEKYPRTLEADGELLSAAGVDVLFAPSVEDIYPVDGTQIKNDYEFGQLDKVMEGEHRPGHFAGVAQVVGRLFDLVQPDVAFFGEKDFQQLAIIRELERQRGGVVEIVGCPIVRAEDGLALSSRNTLLSDIQRSVAPTIYNIISQAVQQKGVTRDIKNWTAQEINKNSELRVEYIEIVDKDSLQTVEEVTDNSHLCAAVFCGNVRLIDNISF